MIKKIVILGALLIQLGCASIPSEQRIAEDPWEPLNRSVYKFNAGLDKVVIKPATRGYRILPFFARAGMRNFFSNLYDVPTAVNNLLQGKVKHAGSDTARFLINTTLGIGGFIDVATPAGLEKHFETFGQTLGVWGVSPGPYLILPVLGPSTVRDTAGLPVDYRLSPLLYLNERPVTDRLRIFETLNIRSGLINTEEKTGIGFYDSYEQMRAVYLTSIAHAVADGVEEEGAGDDLRNELEDLDDDE